MAKGGVKGVMGGEEGCSVGAIASKSQPSPQPASSPPLLLLQAWGLTPLGLERINFVLTPLEAGLQADPCLFTEGRGGTVEG